MDHRSKTLNRWLTVLERIREEMCSLLWQREQIRRIGRMIDDNPRLQVPPRRFLKDIRTWYMTFAAMSLRRQTDKDEGHASLRWLLSDIAKHPEYLTRDHFVECFRKSPTDPEFEGFLVDTDWKKWSSPDGSLNVAIVEEDIESIRQSSRRLYAFASSFVAHTSLKAIAKGTTVTYDEMDALIDRFEELTRKYTVLLTYRGSTGLLPIDHGWYELFSFAWKPRD
jgi:hypothetical protein